MTQAPAHEEIAPGHDEILRVVAPNPGPMTLAGTNTYLYGSEPCAVIDPGPDDEGHLDAVRAAAEERGGIGLVLLTHGHGDHAGGAARFSKLLPLMARTTSACALSQLRAMRRTTSA